MNEFYSQRISELEYLERMKDYRNKVLTKTDSTIPDRIKHSPTASAYYGITHTFYKEKGANTSSIQEVLVDASLEIEKLIESRKIVNWQQDNDVIKKMMLDIGDFMYDEVKEQIGIDMKWSEVDQLTEEIISTAKTRG